MFDKTSIDRSFVIVGTWKAQRRTEGGESRAKEHSFVPKDHPGIGDPLVHAGRVDIG